MSNSLRDRLRRLVTTSGVVVLVVGAAAPVMLGACTSEGEEPGDNNSGVNSYLMCGPGVECYTSAAEETCLRVGEVESDEIYDRLSSVARCGGDIEAGPLSEDEELLRRARESGVEGDCCYKVPFCGCSGRPLIVDGEIVVAPLIARADWLEGLSPGLSGF